MRRRGSAAADSSNGGFYSPRPSASVRPSALPLPAVLFLLEIPNRRKFNASSYIISPVCITYSIGSSPLLRLRPPSLLFPPSSAPPPARILAYFTSLHDS